jgi:hypothetical protein
MSLVVLLAWVEKLLAEIRVLPRGTIRGATVWRTSDETTE